MFDYLQKYQQVPADVRAKLDTPAIKATIKQLEETYHISLASILIKIVIKDVQLSRLSFYLSENYGLSGEQAQKLTADLQARVLTTIQSYLSQPLSAPIDINRLAKSNQIVQSTTPPITNNPTKVLPQNNQVPVDLESILNTLVSQQTIFKQPAQLSRWRQAAKTFLLGVRNQRAIDDFLMRSFDGGGLGISEAQAQQLNQQLIKAKELFHQQARQQITVQVPTKPTDQLIAQSVVRDFESDLLASLRKIDSQPRPELKTETELPAPANIETKLLPAAAPNQSIEPAKKEQPLPIVPVAPTPTIPSPLPTQIPPTPIAQTVEPPINQSATVTTPANSAPTIVVPVDQRSTDNKTGKIRMDDVRFTPKTLTPLDELANLDLKRFRYLGHTTEERGQKIKEKLDLLTEYGYSKRLQGISAWRQSPLNRLYLQAGQKSINSDQTAEQLLNEQANQNPDNLTFAEFVAIMKLNEQIRF